jgi:hypothetical protein
LKSYANASGWLRQLYMMLNRRWLYDKLLNDLFGMPYKLGYHMLNGFDKGLLELLPFAPLGLNGNFKHSR